MFITSELTPCQQSNPDLWFAKEGSGPTRQAKILCRSCPVLDECRDWVLEFEKRMGHTQPGVFGGLSERDRVKFQHNQRAATPH